jgi:hypothetical protein
VPSQQGGARDRLAQLDSTPGWAQAVASFAAPGSDVDAPATVAHIVDSAVWAYSRYAQGNPTMLVHAATAPNAVALTLPELPREVWTDSAHAAWSASAAVISAYAPVTPYDNHSTGATSSDALAQALAHGGEHVIKFADTALTAYQRTGDVHALTAITAAVHLDA